MSSFSKLQLATVAAVAGVTIAVAGAFTVFAVIDYLRPTDRRRKKTRNVPGLYNLGNTCFANALLQSLAACPSFEFWLSNTAEVSSAVDTSLLMELRRVIARLNHSSEDSPASADGVLEALRAHRWNITPDIEQDLFELFNVFVTTWDEELAPFYAGKSYTLADIGELREISCGRLQSLHSITDSVPIRRQYRAPCAGLLGTELRCRNCGIKNVRHDRFCSLDLVLPKTGFTDLSVESCLRKYFAKELLLNYKCENCEAKGISQNPLMKSALLKKQGISKLPDCLILRIQRVGILPSGAPFKQIDHVEFAETLCVRDYLFYRNSAKTSEKASNGVGDWVIRGGGDLEKSRILDGRKFGDGEVGAGDGFSSPGLSHNFDINKYIYNLRAVAVHIGQPESGHFIAYRRGCDAAVANHSRRSTWFLTSDTEVRKVSFDSVAQREAYMLFYERVGSM